MTPRALLSKTSPWLRALTVALLAASTVAACGDDDKTGSCSADNDCAFGLVCGGETCVELPCNSIADCTSGNQACVTVNDGQYCAAVECGCPECDLCPIGEVCTNGFCEGAAACSETILCAGTDVCDDGLCRPCQGAECPADCRTGGCPGGGVCNTDTGECQAAPGVEACSSCTRSDDCGEGWKCVPLRSGNACLPPCGDVSECPAGWECAAGSCTPASYTCTGCAVDGCPNGQACNPADNGCVPAVAACGVCTADWECGEGSACSAGACQPLCTGGTCAAGGACGTSAGGLSVCTDTCASACDPACSGATPICNGGTCVQCRNNGDCAPGQTCDTGTGLCTGTASCQAPTPYPFENTCVECLTNNHCGNEFCDQATKTCSADPCAACADPYPACITYEGEQYCVQCSTDADCVAVRGEGSTCNTATYACEGGVVLPGSGGCETDADCNAGQSGFTLRCNTATKLCYDVGGLCDGATAFCTVGNDPGLENCISFFELMGGGLGGDIGDLGLGVETPGFCLCDNSTPCPGGNPCGTGGGLISAIACLTAPDPLTCVAEILLTGRGVCGL